ncbi:MAG: phenylacetate--CoA ligase, partial [Cyanobacteria bacterium]|nr:phenylacetate--CoA ligase [Cyanobacteriota bacterium]
MSAREKAIIFNRDKECISRKELETLQLQQLKTTLKRVYERVPFYKREFDAAGVSPDIASLSELTHFPFTKKNHLRENYPFGLFASPTEDVRRIHASSGTKGKPTVVGFTDRDLENWKEVCARSLAAAGARPGDIIHNAYGYGLFTGGLGVHYGAENLKATVV